jgi:SAM-dependent methyltransferase
MFWRRARAKYSGVTANDPDVRRFLELSNSFQLDVYGGIGGWIQDEGHRWIAERTGKGLTLEIGFGAGRHNRFFGGDRGNYIASEYSGVHVKSRPWQAVLGRALRCDARALPFSSGAFEQVISIYNLEHIDDLQAVLREVARVLRPDGRFLVALPCEGGFAWNLGRELTTRPLFRKKYGVDYDKVIAFEHVRDFDGVSAEIRRSGLFRVNERAFLPMRLPSVDLNLIGCLSLVRA